MISRPLVYDVGLNNGDDSAYYLKKGFNVVGIDANPGLCQLCCERFKEEVSQGRMTILNVGVGDKHETREFYLNVAEDPISTFLPNYWKGREWIPIQVEVRPLSSIIFEHGTPYFVKIDVEFLDHVVLLNLLKAGIVPEYVSAEAQLIEVYCALVCMGYSSFKLVKGQEIPTRFKDIALRDRNGKSFQHVFSPVSSGPFADDLDGPWLDKHQALARLFDEGLGWIDLHARQ